MNNKIGRYGVFSSSQDPQQLSQTISSLLNIVTYFVGFVAATRGVHFVISNAEIQQLTDALVTVVMSGLTLYQGGLFVVGLFRKLVSTPQV